MKKYWQVVKITLQEYFVYRLNFIMWRFRALVQLLTVYFLWLAISQKQGTIFGYDQSLLLTYILGVSLIRAFVVSSRTADISGEIANGNLSNYLLKPLNYFRYWFFRDMVDKVYNIIFSLSELVLVVWLLKPPVFWQANPLFLLGTFFIIVLGVLLYFNLSFIISLTTFWYTEHGGWPARFLFMVTLEFLAGGLFPLDILPAPIFSFFRFLPSTYLLFFPLEVYLGRVNLLAIFTGVLVMVFWIVILNFAGQFVWQKGLKSYEAYGR